MAKKPESLATITAAAQRVQVHPKTVRRWIKAGRLTCYRVGPRNIRVDLDELDELIQPSREVPTLEPSPLEKYVAQIVAEAPPLTAEQRDRLATLLRSAA